jgi:Presenilin
MVYPRREEGRHQDDLSVGRQQQQPDKKDTERLRDDENSATPIHPTMIAAFYFITYNFAITGVLSIIAPQGAVPCYLTQCFLSATSIITAWHFAKFDPWTAWVLLILLALYDLFAVLSPYGPLRALVNLMQRDDSPMIPGLLYEASLPPSQQQQRQQQQQQQRNHHNQQPSRPPPPPPPETHRNNVRGNDDDGSPDDESPTEDAPLLSNDRCNIREESHRLRKMVVTTTCRRQKLCRRRR